MAEFLGVAPGSVSTYLSEGFPEKFFPKLRMALAKADLPFDPERWGRDEEDEDEKIRVVPEGVNIATVLFEDAFKFLTIRAPTPFAKIPENYTPELDDTGLVKSLDWKKDAPSAGYIHSIWQSLLARKIKGQVITSVRRVSALVELWAAVELIRRKRLQEEVSLFLIPSAPCGDVSGRESHPPWIPIIGARVVNERKCLLSVPISARQSSHTPILISRRTADFIYSYAAQLTDPSISRELTALPLSSHVEAAMESEFKVLRAMGADTATRYGQIDTFEQVTEMTERLYRMGEAGKWYPPLA